MNVGIDPLNNVSHQKSQMRIFKPKEKQSNRRMRLAVNVELMGNRERNITCVDRRIILKHVLRKQNVKCVEWIYLAQNNDRWHSVFNTVMNIWFSQKRECLTILAAAPHVNK